LDDSRTIPDVPINKGCVSKITAERARGDLLDFIAPTTTNEVQKALLGKPLETGCNVNQFQKSTILLTSNT
jgi:hypothetical protein